MPKKKESTAIKESKNSTKQKNKKKAEEQNDVLKPGYCRGHYFDKDPACGICDDADVCIKMTKDLQTE